MAGERGLSTTTKLTKKAELIAAIEKMAAKPAKKPDVWLDDAVKAAKAPAKAAGKAGNTETRPESHPERRDGSGPAKLARLTSALEPYGWKITVKTTGDRIEATAKRGTETLRQVWVDGGYVYGASSYNGRKVRNVAEAIRLCAVKPTS
jgi:hypothetical protein